MKVSSAPPAPSQPAGGPTAPAAARSKVPLALLLSAIVIFAAFVFLVPYTPPSQTGGNIFSQLSNSTTGGSTSTTSTNVNTSVENPACGAVALDHTLAAPAISNGTAKVGYPADYCALTAYILGVINQDRATNGSSPVSLDYNQAAQQHADSMLYYDYFSHFDTQGLKPYMRYSMLGGLGADFENVAYLSYSARHFTSTGLVEQSLKTLEESMMYNDSACCQNGHKYNILSPLHNMVSIGVAYNSTTVFFDEEFENNYITMSFSSTSGSSQNPYYVTMSGTIISGTPAPNSIYIAYDSTPAAETPAALSAGPHEYGPGTLTGGVLPSSGFPPQCGVFESGITVCADTWTFSSGHMDIRFPMQRFVSAYGPGVYTVYLITGSSTNSAIVTISIFVT